MGIQKQTTAQAQLAGTAFSQDSRGRTKEAYNEIHDMISEAKNMGELQRAVEKSLKMMSQYSLDEITRDKLDRHANRRYEQLVVDERRTRREMIANKDRF